MSQLGSGPDTSTSGTGHYSTEDYREILRHATERHIQVIPEFDFPGHSHAAIKSMIARHDILMQQGNEKDAKQFLLNDFKDESRYLSVQMFTDETSNCCLNSTYTLMKYILETLVNLHHDIQPLTVYHFGGDEVPGGAWKKSPACEQLAQTLNVPYNSANTHNKLKEYFLRRLSNLTAKMNIGVGGWGDFLFEPKTRSIAPRKFFPNKEVYSFAWSRTGAVKNNHEVSLMANHGYKVVLSSPDYIYLDHPYEPVGEERGKYWATTYTDTRKIFNFAPEELYEDIDKTRNCSGLKECVDGRQNVLGVEAAVWSETIRTADHMYSMIFPRLLALAERAWHKAPWEDNKDRPAQDHEKTGDWVNFANTLGYKELGRLDKMGVIYHVTPPGARFVKTKLETRAVLPGLKVEYSVDEGVTWGEVTSNMEVEGKIKLRTRSADGQRVSREVEVESPTPTPVKNKNDQNTVSAPEAERKREEQNKGKEGAEHTKGEVKSQGEGENPEIKEKRSEILEEKTKRKEGNSEIKDESSERKDTPSKEKLENDVETKASVKKDIAEHLHDKDDLTNPLQQDEEKLG